jgi:DNA ligase D-like protein (predicted 3'-phosphoesterase)
MDKIYVIQEHHASRLHYDLRLEMDGALKSWALPKEPVNKPAIKRLAIAVEDHELGYETFEGVIPDGVYGAGKVTIWDRGRYDLEKMTEKEILLSIDGNKLNGYFALVKIPDKKNDKWLFFKRAHLTKTK